MSNKSKFNSTITGMYETKRGGEYLSLKLSEKDVDVLQNSAEIGARLYMKVNKHRKNDKSPEFYLEVMSAEDVKRFESDRDSSNSSNDRL